MRQPATRSDRAIAAVFLGLAAFVFFDVWRLSEPITTDLLGPKLYPEILAVLLAALAGLLLIGGSVAHEGDPRITTPGMLRRFLPLLSFSVVYVLLLPYLGFLIATSTLLVAAFSLLGERRLWLNLVIAASCSLCIYLLFALALGIPIKALPG